MQLDSMGDVTTVLDEELRKASEPLFNSPASSQHSLGKTQLFPHSQGGALSSPSVRKRRGFPRQGPTFCSLCSPGKTAFSMSIGSKAASMGFHDALHPGAWVTSCLWVLSPRTSPYLRGLSPVATGETGLTGSGIYSEVNLPPGSEVCGPPGPN